MEFVKNNLLLFAVAVASGAMLLWPLLRRTTGGPWVSAAQATQLINREDALVVDVREAGEYGSGHVLGAKNVPLARLESGAGDVAKNKKDSTLIVYDDAGDRVSKAAAALRKQGYTKVVSLTGGLGAWKQAGLPVER